MEQQNAKVSGNLYAGNVCHGRALVPLYMHAKSRPQYSGGPVGAGNLKFLPSDLHATALDTVPTS